MTRCLILSDSLLGHSDDSQKPVCRGPSQTSPSACPKLASAGADHARDVACGLQAVRPAQLSLRRRPRPWAQILSLGQPARRPTPPRLRAQRRLSACRRVHRQLAHATNGARRDLRHQHRAIAATRGSWIARYGACTHPVRLDAGGLYSCRHGHVLSRRRSATDFGGDGR
jgi:hypothetical protein